MTPPRARLLALTACLCGILIIAALCDKWGLALIAWLAAAWGSALEETTR